jgi:ankyrin repeat protein
MELLFNAVEKNDLLKVKELISRGVNINSIDIYGYSALHVASSKELNDLALFLVDNNIDLNMQDKNGQTILHYVAEYNQLKLAKAALARGAKLSITDKHGNEPLWTAVFNDKGRNDRVEIIKLFLEYGANVDHKNKVDKSPRDIVMIAGYNNLKPLIDKS